MSAHVLLNLLNKLRKSDKMQGLPRELSGRVLDSRPRDRGFEPHSSSHCVVSVSKTHMPCLVLVQPRKTHPDINEKLLTGMHRIKSNKAC